MNKKQRTVRTSKIQTKAIRFREEFWSDVPEEDLWDRLVQDGWVTTPRTMPIIINIIDALTKKAAAGYTFFCLWSRSYGEKVVEIANPNDLAAEAGFSGERAVYTWRQRMKALKDLGFIKTHEGTHDYQFVLLMNPHKVIKNMKGKIQRNLWAQLLNRGMDIGARDFIEDEEEKEEAKTEE
nr:hypothetical protein [uncultured Holophaga sp.]